MESERKFGESEATYLSRQQFLCATSLQSMPKIKKEVVVKRLMARKVRREQGIVLKTQAAVAPSQEATLEDGVVRLKGYTALRRVFPAVPKKEVVRALATVDVAPVQERPALAARVLLRTVPAASEAAHTTKVVQQVSNISLLRSSTTGPTLAGGQPTTRIVVAAPASAQVPPGAHVVPAAVAPAAAAGAAAAVARPKVIYRCSSISETTVAQGAAVPELGPWLAEMGLPSAKLLPPSSRWVDENGACDIDEVVENLDDLVAALEPDLEPGDADRLRAEAAGAAERVKSRMPSVAVSATAAAAAPPTTISVVQLSKAVSTPATFSPMPRTLSSLSATAPSAVPAPVVRVAKPVVVRPSFSRTWSASSCESSSAYCADGVLPRGMSTEWVPVRVRQKKQEEDGDDDGFYLSDPDIRIDEKLLRAKIPAEHELRAVELAQKAAKEAKQARDEAYEAKGGNEQSSKKHEQKEKLEDPLQSAAKLRQTFLSENGDQLLRDFGAGVRIVPAETSRAVEDRFLETCQQSGEMPSLGYHGTKQHHIPSILDKGLIVPGKQGVKVENGSAHGVGIYTAVPGAASLSRGFCDSSDMLVCGIVTAKPGSKSADAAELVAAQKPPRIVNGHRNHRKPGAGAVGGQAAQPKKIGGFNVARNDRIIREVGQARIVFDERYVAPLFIAKGGGRLRGRGLVDASNTLANPAANMLGGRVNVLGSQRGGSGQVVIEGSGERVFLPPGEAVRYRQARFAKRMYVAKGRDRERAQARADKEFMQDDTSPASVVDEYAADTEDLQDEK